MVQTLTSCCCGCSLRTGTQIIAVINLFVYISLGSYVAVHPTTTVFESFFSQQAILYPVVAYSIIHVISNILLIIGSLKTKRGFIYAWLYCKATSLPLEIIAGLFYLILKSDEHDPDVNLLGQFVNFLISIPLGFYLFWVVFSFYRATKVEPQVEIV